VTRLSRFADSAARECDTMRADMSDESHEDFLINHKEAGSGVMPGHVRIARMSEELIKLRRVITILVKDRPDLLRLLGDSPPSRGENHH
jgi:hypothetical protein